ncbi:MAG: 30S ribosomal protein S16 [Chloroflexi bacterium]|nr:30S ribosomal protein S16 [Chloroflexota bacterium]
MVKIRLSRVGAKGRPSYRLVIADSRSPRDGKFIGIIGHYDPLTNPETVSINAEKALHWLKQGAQPTATAARLLSKAGIIEKPKTAYIIESKASTVESKEGVTEKPKTIEEKT